MHIKVVQSIGKVYVYMFESGANRKWGNLSQVVFAGPDNDDDIIVVFIYNSKKTTQYQ